LQVGLKHRVLRLWSKDMIDQKIWYPWAERAAGAAARARVEEEMEVEEASRAAWAASGLAAVAGAAAAERRAQLDDWRAEIALQRLQSRSAV
jgi:hypothetical protein